MNKDEVANILADPLGRGDWSIQGLGMLRLYLDEQHVERLHVWSDMARYDQVSELHTHPWDMLSVIVAGHIRQERFVAFERRMGQKSSHMRQMIQCGEGGGPIGIPDDVLLREMPSEDYAEGDQYVQYWWEIHRTRPADGSVTIITRQFTDDPDHAYVFWPIGQEWVTAEPRLATKDEILRITNNALVKWF